MVLKGIRVVDSTRWAFGPYAAACLADLGAEVIKVEDPRVGDSARVFRQGRDL
jgi:crotonobetainyl-CoA:carnitine CoA-transferase CaiB-like acyl-CoA transferase